MNRASSPKLLILNQMAGPMTWELAEDLSQRFGQVHLLTGHPDTLAKPSRPEMSIHASIAYRRGGTIRRLACWLAYTVHAFLWAWKWPADVPILIFSNPPILVWVVALLNSIRGTKFSIMVHDVYPDVFVRKGLVSWRHPFVSFWSRLNRWAYQRSELVMTLGPYMSLAVSNQFDATHTSAGKIEVVGPWADTKALKRIPKEDNWFARQYDQFDKLTVMYSGNMGLGHDLETMLSAATELRSDTRFHFMFIGAGPRWDSVRDYIIEHELVNATLLPWQTEEDFRYSLSTADIGFVSLEEEMTGLAVPSKAFYFLATSTPLIVSCGRASELADVVSDNGCGTVVDVGDVHALRQAIVDAAEVPGRLASWVDGTHKAMQTHSRVASTTQFGDLLATYLLIETVAIASIQQKTRSLDSVRHVDAAADMNRQFPGLK